MNTKIVRIRRIKFLVFFTDILLLLVSLSLAYSIRFASPITEAFNHLFIYLTSFISLCCLYIFGTYDMHNEENFQSIIFKQIISISTSSLISVGFVYLSRTEISGLLGRGVFLFGNTIYIFISIFYKYFVYKHLKSIKQKWNWFAFGESKILDRLNKDCSSGVQLGSIKVYPTSGDNLSDSSQILSQLENSWSGIILASNSKLDQKISTLLLHKKLSGEPVTDLFQFYEKFFYKVPVFYIDDRWFLSIDGFSISFSKSSLRFKRLLDLMVSSIVLLLTWPILLITALLIKLDSQGPVIYKQTRTGKDGSTFQIFKFRSMTINAEKIGGAQWASQNDNRVTRLGKYLRLFRIDELPQIFNVFKGEMSFIGPRPERPEFNEMLEKQIPYYQLRHLVPPGITGWAQVLYPYGASVEDSIEKLQYDLYYIKNYSFILDLKILFRTVKVIILGKGR